MALGRRPRSTTSLCSCASELSAAVKVALALTSIRCLQHPYLYAEDIEPAGLSTVEAHGKLIDASAKFRLLKAMLPKLRARGHRVLLFSQVSI